MYDLYSGKTNDTIKSNIETVFANIRYDKKILFVITQHETK